jgi:hypothetical protein
LFAGEETGSATRRSVGGVAPGLGESSIGGDGGGGGGGGETGGTNMRRATSTTLELSSPVSVVADTINNSLLVRSSPRDFKKILDALKQLDIVPLQVLVEATIVEITLSGNLKYGVQWSFFWTRRWRQMGPSDRNQRWRLPQQYLADRQWHPGPKLPRIQLVRHPAAGHHPSDLVSACRRRPSQCAFVALGHGQGQPDRQDPSR